MTRLATEWGTRQVRSGLFAGVPGGQLGDEVQVADVPGVLLHQVEQDSLEGRRVRAVPAVTGLPHLVEVVGLDDGLAPRGLLAQPG